MACKSRRMADEDKRPLGRWIRRTALGARVGPRKGSLKGRTRNMMRTEDQRQQDRGDLQHMITQPRPGEDALAAAAMLELCRTLDEAVEQGRNYAGGITALAAVAREVIRDVPPATQPTSVPATQPSVSIGNTPGLKLINTGTIVVGLVLSFLLFTEPGRQIGMFGIVMLMSAVGAMH